MYHFMLNTNDSCNNNNSSSSSSMGDMQHTQDIIHSSSTKSQNAAVRAAAGTRMWQKRFLLTAHRVWPNLHMVFIANAFMKNDYPQFIRVKDKQKSQTTVTHPQAEQSKTNACTTTSSRSRHSDWRFNPDAQQCITLSKKQCNIFFFAS